MCVFKVLVMVSIEANLVTSDLVRWSLQVNEYRTVMVLLLLFVIACSQCLQVALGSDRSVSSCFLCLRLISEFSLLKVCLIRSLHILMRKCPQL